MPITCSSRTSPTSAALPTATTSPAATRTRRCGTAPAASGSPSITAKQKRSNSGALTARKFNNSALKRLARSRERSAPISRCRGAAPLDGRRGEPGRRHRTLRITRTALQIHRPPREASPPPTGGGRPRHPPPLRRNLHPHPAPDRALLLVRLVPARQPRQAARADQRVIHGII